MPHIFISYAKKDTRPLAEALYKALNAVPGLTAWMDRSLEADESWAYQIQREIDRSDYMVVLLSPDVNRLVTASQTRSFVLNEIDYAQQDRKPILPVMAQHTRMPVQIAGIQYIDLTGTPNNPEPIVARVRQRFGIDYTPVVSPVPPNEGDEPLPETTLWKRISNTRLMFGVVIGASVILLIVFIAPSIFNPQAGENDATPLVDIDATAAARLTAAYLPTATDTPDAEASVQARITQIVMAETANVQATIDAFTDTPSPTATATDTPTITPEPPTLTPDLTQTASILATQTQAAQDEVSTQVAQLTANAPTNTPQPTLTPTATPSPTPTSTYTPTPTPTTTLTPTIPAGTETAIAQATQAAFETQVLQTAVAIETVQPTPTQWAVSNIAITTTQSNLRAGPGTNFAVLRSVNVGAQLSILEENDNGDWMRVQLADGTEGWIAAFLISVVPPTLTPTPTPTLTPSIAPTFSPQDRATLQAASTPISRNSDWTPVERDFDGITMVLVPAGCFDMGDNGVGGRQCFDEPFWIGKYEVTNIEYGEFINVREYDSPYYWTEEGWQAKQDNNWIRPSYWTNTGFNSAEQPVVGVSWYEALAYATWRGLTLCTEAEWEYSARGPDGWIYPWGNTFIDNNLVYNNNSDGRTASIGSRPDGTSWVGSLDLSGNVWEWVLSEYRDYPYNTDDGRENISSEFPVRRVLRGGAWRYDHFNARTVVRLIDRPGNRGDYVGFRVCSR